MAAKQYCANSKSRHAPSIGFQINEEEGNKSSWYVSAQVQLPELLSQELDKCVSGQHLRQHKGEQSL